MTASTSDPDVLRSPVQRHRPPASRPGRYPSPTGDEPSTPDLVDAARLAWRNADRCIGRLYWQSLVVRDRRHLGDPHEIASDLAEHLRVTTNGGRIRPVATVFDPSVRILNEQLAGYAGHVRPDGTVLGDGRHTAITAQALAAGWRPATPGRFDLLPLLIQVGDGPVTAHELPAGAVCEIPVRHPDLPWFADLDLRWYATPVITDMTLWTGSDTAYPLAFGGWYLGTEIACRDLADADRYDALPAIADRLGLDRADRSSLWQDRAEHELNRAVLHSFDADGVRITDHHTESERFLTFVEREEAAGRPVRSDWSWIVPPQAAARLGVYHTYQEAPESSVLPAYRRDAVPGRCPVAHGGAAPTVDVEAGDVKAGEVLAGDAVAGGFLVPERAGELPTGPASAVDTWPLGRAPGPGWLSRTRLVWRAGRHR